MNAVDLFAGARGWCEGVRDLGLDPLGIEWNADACATSEAAGHRVLQADVSELDPLDFAPCDMVIGSPPCPTFSSAGDGNGHLVTQIILGCATDLCRGLDSRWDATIDAYGAIYPSVLAAEEKKAAKNRRLVSLAKVETKARRDAAMSLLVVEPLRWALALRPGLIALEQVPGVLPIWQAVADMLHPLGYSVWAGKLNAETFGVPQTRQRAFLMASLHGPVHPPRATHQTYEKGVPAQEIHMLEGTLAPWVCMADALGWGATARPSTTVVGHSDSGGRHGIDGGSGSRASIERVGFRLARGAGMTERHGERPDTPASEPAPVITSKARTARWYDRRQGHTQPGGGSDDGSSHS